MNTTNTKSVKHPVRLTLDQIEHYIQIGSDGVSGRFGDIQLDSAFQPIFSLAHRRPVGYEALLRPYAADGTQLSPLAVFDLAKDEAEGVLLDRMCRIVHTRNFMSQADDTSWLFLNIDPRVTVYGKRYGAFFVDVLERYQISPHRIVIEILEGQIQDEKQLTDAVMFFKEIGCLVALDDFGAGHSNFNRIWNIQPHIVKLDRSIIMQAAASRTVRRVIPNLVNLIHEAGSLVLMEGVETEEEALIAMDSDVDFVQGYYFGRPAKTLLPESYCSESINNLCTKFKLASKQESGDHKNRLHEYLHAFQVFVDQVKTGVRMHDACEKFLSLPKAERCYLLDHEGRQKGNNFVALSSDASTDPRFKPLASGHDAHWARRHYFRRAINQPDEIQVSRPYLSIAGGNICVTLSAAVFNGNERVVLCADLKWSD